MARVSLPIVLGTDDANESQSTTVITNLTVSSVVDDAGEWIGLRFQNVAIPHGSQILSAILSVFCPDNLNDSADHNIWGQADDNPATFSINPADISSRPLTTATLHWFSLDMGAPGRFGVDIKDIVQEIVNRPGWISGNSVAILIEGIAPAGNALRINMFENGSDFSQLDIEFASFVSTSWQGTLNYI